MSAPGKHYRKGISLMDLMEMFPDERSATKWFEAHIWPDGRCCGHCGSIRTKKVPKKKPMPYWCTDCRSYFSVRTGTTLAHTRVPLQKWAIAIYLEVTSLKAISSMKLHRDIKVTQTTAWFMLHRIREGWRGIADGGRGGGGGGKFYGPVEVDETYVGGKRANMHKKKRAVLKGRGTAGKSVVVGMKDRKTNKIKAQVVEHTDTATLQRFVLDHTDPSATVYTDDAAAYHGLPRPHATVRHSIGEYVNVMSHTNGIESFWATLKRAYKGTFHKISPKHLNRYVKQFAGKHNVRKMDTIDQMTHLVAALVGRRLSYAKLIRPNGLPSGSRPLSKKRKDKN